MARKYREAPRKRQQDAEEREHAQLRKELQEDLRRTRELEARQARAQPRAELRYLL